MTELLERAIAQLKALPADEQGAIAQVATLRPYNPIVSNLENFIALFGFHFLFMD